MNKAPLGTAREYSTVKDVLNLVQVRLMFRIYHWNAEKRAFIRKVNNRLLYGLLVIVACLHFTTISTFWPLPLSWMSAELQ